MKTRYRLIRRGRGNGIFYCVDSKTGKRASLGRPPEEARQIVDPKNQAERQPMLNLQLYRRFQNELIENPERGDVIQGTGGFRKARMRLAGGGKNGGARVIYLYLAEHNVIFLATLYKKSKRETLTDDEKQNLKEAARRIKAHFKLG